jgi:putative membrane protein
MEFERRLHPLSFLFAIQESAKQFVVPALVALFAARGRNSWEIWAAVVVVPMALVALARALSVRYRFDETEFVLRSGFIFKRVRHIPYDRIQNVDAVQNILHRAAGVMDVRIETGGGGETEAVLRVVDREALAEIRAHVFGKRSVAVADGTAPLAPSPTVLLAMPPREILLFGLIHGKGMLVVGALFGILWEFRITDWIGAKTFEEGGPGRGVVRQLMQAVFDDAAFPVWQVMIGIVAFALVLSLFRVLSAFWTLVTYYGFTLTRSDDDLRSEYGLLTRVTSTIPLHRIQEVVIREGPWHRRGQRVSIAVQTAGGNVGEEISTRRAWLAPLVRRADMSGLLEIVIPEAPADPDWQPVQPRGARREFTRLGLFLLPVSAVAIYVLHWRGLAVMALLLLWALIHARRSVGALRWTTSGGAIQFASGWIWRKLLMAPLQKIQVVSRHESPFDRRHRMASVFVDTAGRARVDYSIRIPYLARRDADTLADDLAASAAQTTFRW